MAHRNHPVNQCLFDGRRRTTQPQQIGNMAAAFADSLGQLCLRIGELIDKPLISFSFFDRIEIGTLDIFDQANLQSGDIIDRLNNHRHLVQPRLLRGTPAPFTGNDFEAVTGRAHQQGLQHARFLHRGGERIQFFLGEIFTRLKCARFQLVNTDIAQAAISRFSGALTRYDLILRRRDGDRRRRRIADQG